MTLEEKIREDLRQYLTGLQAIDAKMPECPDVEEAWAKVGEDYLPDGIREFAAYPTVSLGWIMFVGMAMAYLWDTDWEHWQYEPHPYLLLRDKRGFDHTDDYIMDELLQMDAAQHTATSRLVSECAHRTYALLRHEALAPGSAEAFRGYIACLHQLYLMGMAVQLHRMGYRMTQMV